MTSFEPGQYKETLLFLATAGLVVPLFRRLRISPILGFLLAGVALGPYGLGALAHGPASWLAFLSLERVEEIEPIAEFGVVFLLFMIGLELSWERLARMRALIFGLGSLQVFGCAAAFVAIALALGQEPPAALVLGFALSLSSTAIVIPALAEKKRLGTSAGRTIFSVLLFQDLMVAPLLFMVTVLDTRSGDFTSAVVSTLLPAIAALSLIVLGGRLLMRPFFHLVAAAGSTEFFIAACLFTVIGISVIAAMSGLSMGLGAFIAGLLLAETEYRREIEVTIEPFKGLLLGLFFVSIGASLNPSEVVAAPLETIGIALGFIAIKFLLTVLAGFVMRLNGRVVTEAAFLLGPGGEFAFVLLSAALAAKLMPAKMAGDVEIAVTLSMFLVPTLAELGRKFGRKSASIAPDLSELPESHDDSEAPEAILIGYGRVGRLVGELLHVHKIRFLAVDQDAGVVKEAREEGADICWGNATRMDFLHRCGISKAKALIITMDANAIAEEIVAMVRAAYPWIIIVARARDAKHATVLYKLGVNNAVPETIEASLQLSEATLIDLGVPMGLVIASIHEKRDEFRKILQPEVDGAAERYELKRTNRLKDWGKRRVKTVVEE
ncbi:cation:proton antiporter [Beijerinckia indica]|uniref:Sodium/hydrogen exchanger n=1 Tax=Beijerinckia indica subsp. indica (strain ATCC 9039 / DSM 1715 / NCIMB 8712) TaxID=395963 RepID=B2IJK9_BEII9|nr:cation:proton antiporter [Beijerinckia indica]ACB94881.1 sodium/hydrogen exchanger [Beijerinckia indica subsp. indica ATCC 9039]